jgi:hypothetical protein
MRGRSAAEADDPTAARPARAERISNFEKADMMLSLWPVRWVGTLGARLPTKNSHLLDARAVEPGKALCHAIVRRAVHG